MTDKSTRAMRNSVATDGRDARESSAEDDSASVSAWVRYWHAQWQYARQHTTKSRVLFFLRQHIPILEWLPSYDLHEDLQYDLVSGLTVGLMIVPQEISLSTMMGVPPIYGLYTAAIVPLVYALFGTSRVLSVANGAEVSLLVGSAIKKIESEGERVATGILLSFLCGFFLTFMGVFRLGVLADYFSRPVMGGFISAGGVLIMLSQCANWLGIKVPRRDLPFLEVLDVIEKLPHWNGASFALGGFSIAILLGMRALKRRVVRQMAVLEDALEQEFEAESSRALERLGSSRSAVSDIMDDEETDTELTAPAKIEMVGEEATEVVVTSEETETKHKQQEKKEKEKETISAASTRELPHASNTRARPSVALPSPHYDLNVALYSTGSLRRSELLTSPNTTDTRWVQSARAAFDSTEFDIRTSRQGDLAMITRSTRQPLGDVLNDEGVGFSLSDEDYLQLERRLPFATTTMRRDATLLRTPGRAPTTRNEAPPVVDATVSPAKSTSDDTSSTTDSATSRTALKGKHLDSLFESSSSIRLMRSKIAGLIALRLVCDLGAFVVCVLGGAIGYVVGEEAFDLVGKVPGGYPAPVLPWYGLLNKAIDTDRLNRVFIDALSIAIITYMLSIAMAKRLALKEGYRVRPNQELIALGLSNLVGAFFQAMPSTGGLSRTAVNMQNARTQLASLITVLVTVITLYTATSAIAYLPKTSLAAIIIVAGQSLLETKEAKWLYRVKRDEFWVWLASFVLTVMLGVLPGLLASIFCSLVAVIYKTRRPMLTLLGEIVDDSTGETQLVDLDLHPDTARPLSDIVVIRVEGALYFANCEYVERVVEREICKREQTEGVTVHGVILDACAIMDWDSTTIQMMKHLQEELHVRSIQLAIVNAREQLQHLLESTEFVFGIVHNDARIGFGEAIAAIREDAIHIDPEDIEAGAA